MPVTLMSPGQHALVLPAVPDAGTHWVKPGTCAQRRGEVLHEHVGAMPALTLPPLYKQKVPPAQIIPVPQSRSFAQTPPVPAPEDEPPDPDDPAPPALPPDEPPLLVEPPATAAAAYVMPAGAPITGVHPPPPPEVRALMGSTPGSLHEIG